MFKRFGWIFLLMIPVGAFAGIVIAAVVTYVMPKKYESEAIIEVRPLANAPVEPPRKTEGEAPAWLLMETEKMRSRPNLEKVSQNLGLPNRWYLADDQVPPILKDSLRIQSIRGSDLVSIRMRHTNKIDARDIAMELAKVYQSHRKDIAERQASQMLYELRKVVRDQEDKVEERRKVLATIVRTKGINQQNSDQSYGDAKRAFEADQELLQTLKLKLIGEEISSKMPRDSVTVHDSPVISESPVSPNVTLNLILGTVLGAILFPLVSLPLMWFLNRRRTEVEA